MLRVEDFNTVCRHFLLWDLFCHHAPAAPTCTTSPPADASHFAIDSDVCQKRYWIEARMLRGRIWNECSDRESVP